MKLKVFWAVLLLGTLTFACAPTPTAPGGLRDAAEVSQPSVPSPGPAPVQATDLPPAAEPTQAPAPEPLPVTPQQTNFGPDLANFPASYNPLTGRPVADPSLLELPAVLVSISHFPASARPLAGLSFAPWVMEMYISEGTTRFLTAFYGSFPSQVGQVDGGCAPRVGPFVPAGADFIGNQAWLDGNGNGQQDAGELGVGGVCVSLLDASSGAVLASSSTDSNGYYGFDVTAGQSYLVRFEAPEGMALGAGMPQGQSAAFSAAAGQNLGPQAGLRVTDQAKVGVDPVTWQPLGENPSARVDTFVGPVRSGRLPYAYVRDFFQSSCLVYAGSDPALASALKGCAMAFGNDDGGAGSLLDVTRMKKIAEQNARTSRDFNYSGNLFAAAAPAGGVPASELRVYYSLLNQARWSYDPLMGSWLRFQDKAEGSGNFYPDTDRLTGRQLHFENVIVLAAAHTATTPTIIDINLRLGESGDAWLFRDGQVYPIRWTTAAGDYEKTSGLRRPLRFTDATGKPFPLKPGSTWLHVVTPATTLAEESPAHWLMRFYAPVGSR